jgi:hypothetical protein
MAKMTLKTVNGKHIVGVNGKEIVFNTWSDAWNYIMFRRTFNI